MDVSLMPLINEVLQGTPRAIIAILLIVIGFLFYEVRTYRKDLREAQELIEQQRKDYIDQLTMTQDKLLNTSSEMVNKYHEAMRTQSENNASLRDLIKTVLSYKE